MSRRGPTSCGYQPSKDKYQCPVKDCSASCQFYLTMPAKGQNFLKKTSWKQRNGLLTWDNIYTIIGYNAAHMVHFGGNM